MFGLRAARLFQEFTEGRKCSRIIRFDGRALLNYLEPLISIFGRYRRGVVSDLVGAVFVLSRNIHGVAVPLWREHEPKPTSVLNFTNPSFVFARFRKFSMAATTAWALSGIALSSFTTANFPGAAIEPQELLLDMLQDLEWLIVNAISKKLNNLSCLVEHHCDKIIGSTVHRKAHSATERLLGTDLFAHGSCRSI